MMPSAFIVCRKGNKIKNEVIYTKSKIVKIQLIELNGNIYWIKRVNGIIKDFTEVTSNAKETSLE